MARVRLPIPGLHNVLNALAAVTSAALLAAASVTAAPGGRWDMVAAAVGDLDTMRAAAERAAATLSVFKGVKRRFELRGEGGGCRVYDDYAHHPTEVRAVIQAAMQRHDGDPVWIVFQPHTQSRLLAFMGDFARCFEGAARVIVTETFAARSDLETEAEAAESAEQQQEQEQRRAAAKQQPVAGAASGAAAGGELDSAGNEGDLSAYAGSAALALASAIQGVPAVFVPRLADVADRLSWELKGRSALDVDGTVTIVTVGAGDVTSVGCEGCCMLCVAHRLE